MTGSSLKNSRARVCRFSADDASQPQLRNRFSVLETDPPEAVQQSPGFLKQKISGVISVGKFERRKER
jgi:predicted methyltransferase